MFLQRWSLIHRIEFYSLLELYTNNCVYRSKRESEKMFTGPDRVRKNVDNPRQRPRQSQMTMCTELYRIREEEDKPRKRKIVNRPN